MIAQTIDTKHILIHLTFDWQQRLADGFVEITLSPAQETNTIYLDAGMLKIKSVFLNNKLLSFSYDGSDTKDNLLVQLDKTYQTNETLTLKINYTTTYENRSDPNAIWGSFGKGLRFQGPTATTPSKRRQIWSSGEPEGNKYWFPCHEAIEDIHTTEVIATVEKPLMVISNGTLQLVKDNSNNTRTFHYTSDTPFPNYLVAIVVGEYDDVMLQSNATTIHNYGYPHERDAVKATTELLPSMLQFLEEKTNYTYPFKQYSQVVVQDYPFPGLVGQHSVSILSDNYIDDYGVHKDFKYLWDGVAVEALASQWFGSLIMPKTWGDIWLSKAFAQYFAGLFTEKDNGRTEYLSYIQPFEKGNVLSEWEAGVIHPTAIKNTDQSSFLLPDSYSKYRGALILRILQKEIGEEYWWKAIQLFVKTSAYKQVRTSDFQKTIEQVTGKSYQWFFDQWVYKMGLPHFEVTQQYDTIQKQLILIVKQPENEKNDSAYAQVRFYTGKLDVGIENAIHTIRIEPKAENRYVFSLSIPPKFIHFNVEGIWICKTEFKKSCDEYLMQLKYCNDVLAKQEALDQLVGIANDTSIAVELKERIKTAFCNEIQSKTYWRYRVYAMGSLRKIVVAPYDDAICSMLLDIIKTEHAWLKTSAIFSLGNTKEEKYVDVYVAALKDSSDRVVNAAAVALGKTKSHRAYAVLMDLEHKPSWKNQSRISALNGLEQLADDRAATYVLNCIKDNTAPRWFLATPVWDYPYAAANTLVTFRKADEAFPILFKRFKQALTDNDINDIFQNVQLIDILNDKRGTEVYCLLKEKFKADTVILGAVQSYEQQYLERIKD